MAKIPYHFETPVPTYFRENGWFEDENAFKFITWAFSKCSKEPRKIVMQGIEITLQPFEFIAGRLTSSKECFLTQKQFRKITEKLLKEKVVKKTANTRANKFTCYVFDIDRFTNTNVMDRGQHKGQQRANRGPTEGHKLDYKRIRFKEYHPSIPSYPKSEKVWDDGRTDDFLSKGEQEKLQEVIEGVFLTLEDLERCVRIKGSLEAVKTAMKAIQGSKKRRKEILDWPNALARWKIDSKLEVNLEENFTYAKKLCNTFKVFEKGNGWKCSMYNDKKKDQKGILFEHQSPYVSTVFIPFSDGEFEVKCNQTLDKNNMRIA